MISTLLVAEIQHIHMIFYDLGLKSYVLLQ